MCDEHSGLLSPLIKVTSMYRMFEGNTYYTDRHVFENSSGAAFAVNDITYFAPKIIYDNVNDLTANELYNPTTTFDGKGNVEGFFKYLPNINALYAVLYETD